MIKLTNMVYLKIKKIVNRSIAYIKKWNWSLFFIIFLISMCGAMANKNMASLIDSFILGIIGGVSLGLPLAWLTMDVE